MRAFLAVVLLVTLPIAADGVSHVEGRVVHDATALPGCTVTLTAGSVVHRVVSNEQGRYSFPAIPSGAWELTFEMEGFEGQRVPIDAKADVTTAVDVELSIDVTKVRFTCNMARCNDTEPETPFDWESCTEYSWNSTLIQSGEGGDRSAIELLRQRYKATTVHEERHRIAAALLGRAGNDREYWNELSEHAAEAIRFAYVEDEPTEEFVQWCASRSVEPNDYRLMTLDALSVAAPDRRARPLLVKALESPDHEIVDLGLASLALHHPDESLLPAIEKTLEHLPEDAGDLAYYLLAFRSDAADRVAMKYLPEDRVQEYREMQRELAESPQP